MPNESSTSARVFYPRTIQADLAAVLPERARQLTAVFPLHRMWLFGSWAKGKATAFSDIDVLVIYEDPPRADAYALVRRVIGLRGLKPHVYTQQEAEQVSQTLQRMTGDAVLLYPPSA